MTRGLLVAKVPVPGLVKTRLAASVGAQRAADLAHASLADTVDACVSAFGVDRCHVALSGDPSALGGLVDGWTVTGQRGDDLASRLVHAHRDVADAPVVQVGMDTPQVTGTLLSVVARMLADHEAVLGPAEDGGWWVLGLRDPHAAVALSEVPMSTPDTGVLTREALERHGLRVGEAPMLRDVDTAEDADAVARLAPDTRFGRAWLATRGLTSADGVVA